MCCLVSICSLMGVGLESSSGKIFFRKFLSIGIETGIDGLVVFGEGAGGRATGGRGGVSKLCAFHFARRFRSRSLLLGDFFFVLLFCGGTLNCIERVYPLGVFASVQTSPDFSEDRESPNLHWDHRKRCSLVASHVGKPRPNHFYMRIITELRAVCAQCNHGPDGSLADWLSSGSFDANAFDISKRLAESGWSGGFLSW